MTDRELDEKLLDVLENHVLQRTYAGGVHIANAAIALRERLARGEAELSRQEQEPVATKISSGMVLHDGWDDLSSGTKLYAAPQPAQQPLPERELGDIAERCGCMSADWLDFARAIEAAHGITGEKK